jgi:hypothetical protein
VSTLADRTNFAAGRFGPLALANVISAHQIILASHRVEQEDTVQFSASGWYSCDTHVSEYVFVSTLIKVFLKEN